MSEVQVMHMKIGDGFGTTMNNIAREKMMDYDLEGALKFLMDSLPGMTRKDAFEIAIGIYDLRTIGQELEMITGKEGMVPFIEHRDYMKRNIVEYSRKFTRSISGMAGRGNLLQHTNVELSINRADIIRFINDDDTFGLRQAIEEDENVQDIVSVVNTVQTFLNKSMKAIRFYEDVSAIGIDVRIEVPPKLLELSNQIMMIMRGASLREAMTVKNNVMLDNFLTASKSLDAIRDVGIKPMKADGECNAAWIAPNGDFFGLSGEIANLLHLQISDMLEDSGYFDGADMKGLKPDNFMQSQGWIKVHGQKIFSDLGYNVDLKITDEQIKAVTLYATKFNKLDFGSIQLTSSQLSGGYFISYRRWFNH